MLFVLTVDTEADNQWDHGRPLRTLNVRYWEPFQRICERHGVPPTYLITSEIAADREAQGLLKDWVRNGSAEVGAHLHAWTTPPFLDRPGFRFNDEAHAFLNELPTDLVHAKIRSLTDEIESQLEIRPASFRGGRFGFDSRCAAALGALGYSVDSSVTPLTEWSRHEGLPGGRGGPDFRSFTTEPFFISEAGENRVLELPITIAPTYRILESSRALLGLYATRPARAVRRLALHRWLSPQPVWLQPSPGYKLRDLEDVLERQRVSSPVAVMMFHSSELMPGGSPFRPGHESVAELLELFDVFLSFVREHGVAPVTLGEAANRLRESGGLETRPLGPGMLERKRTDGNA